MPPPGALRHPAITCRMAPTADLLASDSVGSHPSSTTGPAALTRAQRHMSCCLRSVRANPGYPGSQVTSSVMSENLLDDDAKAASESEGRSWKERQVGAMNSMAVGQLGLCRA